jgi:hypothetical protein
MSENPGHRRNNPSDPTAERASDPVPVGDDVNERDNGLGQGKKDEAPVIPAEEVGGESYRSP